MTLIDTAEYTLAQFDLPSPPAKGPAILIYDIETAPSIVYTWGQWKTNVIGTVQDWYMLSFAYKWFGQRRTHFVSIYQDPTFTPGTDNDLYVIQRLAALYDKADVVIAHNGDKFDQRKAAARMLHHQMSPPSPFQEIDTLKEARRYFALYSNALNELGRYLDLGQKTVHQGFGLWKACMAGDPKAWRTMERYNRRDVKLLEDLYVRLRPWIGKPGKKHHPNLGMWQKGETACPKCGKVGTLIKRGRRHRGMVNEYVVLQCSPAKGGCGGYSRSRESLRFPVENKVRAV